AGPQAFAGFFGRLGRDPWGRKEADQHSERKSDAHNRRFHAPLLATLEFRSFECTKSGVALPRVAMSAKPVSNDSARCSSWLASFRAREFALAPLSRLQIVG